MEAKKDHDMLSESWNQKSWYIIHFKSKRLRIEGLKRCEPWSLMAGESSTPCLSDGRKRWMSQLKNRDNLPFLHLFVPVGASQQVDDVHPHLRTDLLSLLNQILLSSRNTPTDRPRNKGLPVTQASLSPVTVTKLTIIPLNRVLSDTGCGPTK